MKIIAYLHTDQYGVLIGGAIFAIAWLAIAHWWNVLGLIETVDEFKKDTNEKHNRAINTPIRSCFLICLSWMATMYHLRHFSYGLPLFVRCLCALVILFLLVFALYQSWVIAKKKYHPTS